MTFWTLEITEYAASIALLAVFFAFFFSEEEEERSAEPIMTVPPTAMADPTTFSMEFFFIDTLSTSVDKQCCPKKYFYAYIFILPKKCDRIKRKGWIDLFDLNIVLIEPEIPQNTGNIARTCAATGAKLHLVEPMGFRVDDRKLKRAGLDYWYLLDITYYASMQVFFEKHPEENFYYFTTKAKHRHTEIRYPQSVYLVFGKETAGLPESLLHENPDTSVRIPMISEARSLNLSNAAAIGVYEVLRQWDYTNLLDHGELRSYSCKKI